MGSAASVQSPVQVGVACMEAFLGVKPKGLWILGLAMDNLHDDENPVPTSTMALTDNRQLIANECSSSWGP